MTAKAGEPAADFARALRDDAARYRRLAKAINDSKVISLLEAMAGELDDRARRVEAGDR